MDINPRWLEDINFKTQLASKITQIANIPEDGYIGRYEKENDIYLYKEDLNTKLHYTNKSSSFRKKYHEPEFEERIEKEAQKYRNRTAQTAKKAVQKNHEL